MLLNSNAFLPGIPKIPNHLPFQKQDFSPSKCISLVNPHPSPASQVSAEELEVDPSLFNSDYVINNKVCITLRISFKTYHCTHSSKPPKPLTESLITSEYWKKQGYRE